MPRLIDADKYCEFLNTYPLEKAQSNFMTFYRDALQHTFEYEVDAIPIDWLLDKLLEYDLLETHHTICCLWERWKEENEKQDS